MRNKKNLGILIIGGAIGLISGFSALGVQTISALPGGCIQIDIGVCSASSVPYPCPSSNPTFTGFIAPACNLVICCGGSTTAPAPAPTYSSNTTTPLGVGETVDNQKGLSGTGLISDDFQNRNTASTGVTKGGCPEGQRLTTGGNAGVPGICCPEGGAVLVSGSLQCVSKPESSLLQAVAPLATAIPIPIAIPQP